MKSKAWYIHKVIAFVEAGFVWFGCAAIVGGTWPVFLGMLFSYVLITLGKTSLKHALQKADEWDEVDL